MTKEPKLQAAVRIVAEWTDYDQEIKRLQGRVQDSADGASTDQSTGTARAALAGKTQQAERVSEPTSPPSPQRCTRSCEQRQAGGPDSV